MSHLEEWLKRELKEHTDQAYWDSSMAHTLQAQLLFSDAAIRWSAVLEAQPENWRAAYGLASALSRDGKDRDAVDRLNNILQNEQLP